MNKKLENLLLKICEIAPLNITFYEYKGKCTKTNTNCDYCKKINVEYFCYKQTYLFDSGFSQV